MPKKKDDFKRCGKCGEELTFKELPYGVCCTCQRIEADKNETIRQRHGSADVEN